MRSSAVTGRATRLAIGLAPFLTACSGSIRDVPQAGDGDAFATGDSLAGDQGAGDSSATGAPIILDSAPSGALPAGTRETTLRVTTDVNATCRYNTTGAIAYAAMTDELAGAPGTVHTATVSGLSDGASYLYFVRCSDGAGNANQSDYRIAFSVQLPVADGTPWAYPGIPYTDWAYNPFTIELEPPVEWPAAAAAGFYYVEPDNPAASDTSLDGELEGDFGRYGYPNRPRATLPSNGWIADVFTAGTVVWIKGGTFTGSNLYRTWSPRLQGSESAPVWLYGDPSDPQRRRRL